MLQQKSEPDFIFDPDAITNCFIPFQRILPGLNFRHSPERVIAPVPSKTDGLLGEFVSRIHKRAVEIFKSTRAIVAIGYSFNPHDRDSYVHLLEAASGAKIILVVPEAHRLVSRLGNEYPGVEWQPVSMTFREWSTRGYEGI